MVGKQNDGNVEVKWSADIMKGILMLALCMSVWYTDKKENQIYIRKFRMEQLQSHI
jgi:hypothetical protein